MEYQNIYVDNVHVDVKGSYVETHGAGTKPIFMYKLPTLTLAINGDYNTCGKSATSVIL